MTPQEFCYWLQGYLEVADPKEISGKQLEAVKKHLQLVFTKVTDKSPKDLTALLECRLEEGSIFPGRKYC